MFTKIYNVIHHGTDKKYKFIGALNDEINAIFDKHNKNTSLSANEKQILRSYYGKKIISDIEGHV